MVQLKGWFFKELQLGAMSLQLLILRWFLMDSPKTHSESFFLVEKYLSYLCKCYGFTIELVRPRPGLYIAHGKILGLS